MVELNNRDRSINVKIVYYGAAVCGKTTNIQMLHTRAAANRRGELVSVNSAQDRTIMFDLLPIKATGFRGFDLKLQLVAVPGQAMYAAIRKITLRNVDALVFVANSANDRHQENVASFREMTGNLVTQHIDPATLPLVLQYNKRDLPEILDIQSLDRTLNARQTQAFPAVAIRGEGVLETFKAILILTVQDLARRYRLLDGGREQTVDAWATTAIQEIFGTDTFAPSEGTAKAPAPRAPAAAPVAARPAPSAPPPSAQPPPPPAPPAPSVPAPPVVEAPAPPDRRTVRVALPSDISSAATPDARANEALVESYAEAASTLTLVTQELRDERDLAQRRLADVLQVLEVARLLKPGASADPVLGVALECLAQEVDAACASFLVKDPVEGIRIAAQRGLKGDPFLSDAAGIAQLPDLFGVPAAHVLDAERNPALIETLRASEPPFGSVVSVAFTARSGTGALALLYLPPNAAPPSGERLSHITALARILAPWVDPPKVAHEEPTPARHDTGAPGHEAMPSAPDLLGTACRLAAAPLLQSLLTLRQQQADLRRHAGAPPWLAEGFAQMASALGDAVATARAFHSFDQGELQRERVEVGELVAPLSGGRANLAADVAEVMVAAQPVLLRLAMQALIDAAPGRGDGDDPVEIHCAVEGERLITRIGTPGPAAALPLDEDPRLLFAAEVISRHGGRLRQQNDSPEGSWAVFDVPRA
jgi:signal recognition particle receptor subunit beta